MKIPYGYLPRQFPSAIADKIWFEAVRPIVTRGDFTLGEEVKQFERNFASFIGSKHCIGVANGTDALELAIWAQGFPPGAEIIVPANTFVASVASVITAGMRPVFVDVNEKYVMDPERIEEAITDNTVAILPVHFAGQPCDMEAIMKIAGEHELLVIEDAAQAAGAISNAGPCGNVGIAAGISFHPQKNLNAWGDAGAIMTSDAQVYSDLLLYRNHGMLDRDTYEVASRNSRLDTIHAAVLNFYLPMLTADNDVRRGIASIYNRRIGNHVVVPTAADDEKHTYHLYIFRIPGEDSIDVRNDLLKHLRYFGVDARVHYPMPLYRQQAFRSFVDPAKRFQAADRQSERTISLPIHQYMTSDEANYVCDVVENFFR